MNGRWRSKGLYEERRRVLRLSIRSYLSIIIQNDIYSIDPAAAPHYLESKLKSVRMIHLLTSFLVHTSSSFTLT